MLRFAWILLFITSLCRAENIRIAGTEWPPYMGAGLPAFGAASAVVTEAFRSVGVKVSYDFLPWQRTVKEGIRNPVYVGYMPAYFSDERSRSGYVSDQIAMSHIGFAKSSQRVLQWSTDEDLARYRVGLVKGYVNTPLFDHRLHAGDPNLDLAVSDENNLAKLAAGRIDMALIDQYVFAYYQKFSSQPGVNATNLDFLPVIVEQKPVYIFFQKTLQGQRMRSLFHQGMKKIQPARIFLRTMQTIVPHFTEGNPKSDAATLKP